MLFAALGLNPARGLTVGIVRRIRELADARLRFGCHRVDDRSRRCHSAGSTRRVHAARPVPETAVARRTLFLHPPSFEGFDGGAGSRYQARREIRSFWYRRWLAQPAAHRARQPSDRRPARRPLGRAGRSARSRIRPGGAAHEHALVRERSPGGRALEARELRTPRRVWSARTSRVLCRGSRSAPRRPSDWVGAGRVRLTPAPRSRRGGRSPTSQGIAYRDDGPDPFTPPRAADRGHGRSAVRRRRLPARPDHRELLHRIPPASLRVALHGAGVPIEVHLLPVAADRRRPPLSHAQRRSSVDAEIRRARDTSRRSRSSSSTTTRSPTTCRAPRRSLAAWAGSGVTWSCNAKANVPRRDARRSCGTTAAPAAGRLRVGLTQQILNNIKKGTAASTVARSSPRSAQSPRHHDPRDVHPRPSRETPRDDPGDDPLCARDRAATPSRCRSRAPYPGDRALPAGGGAGVAPSGRREAWSTGTVSSWRR